MRPTLYSGLLAAALLAGADCAAVCQTPQSPAPQKQTAPEKSSARDRFPFPGETSGTAKDPAPPDSPTVHASPATHGTAEKQFPFPGEASGNASEAPAPVAASSSSSSSDSDRPADSDSTPDLKDKGSEGQQTQPSGRHILHRVNPPGTKLQSPEERFAEDLDVANFYMDRGDFKAAYLRGQDALKLQPDDPSAHFLLAETAAKLNKPDEAIAHYEACLKFDPTDKQAKAAQKALARLRGQH